MINKHNNLALAAFFIDYSFFVLTQLINCHDRGHNPVGWLVNMTYIVILLMNNVNYNM